MSHASTMRSVFAKKAKMVRNMFDIAKKRKYRSVIDMLCKKALLFLSFGKTEMSHVYSSLPVKEDGLRSVVKIRHYIGNKMKMKCEPIIINGNEIGIRIYM